MIKLVDLLNETLEFGSINEAGLSRMLSQTKGNDFCIVTAFRDNYSLKQNRQRNGEILKLLNSKKMGGYMLIGHWQEAPDGVDYADATADQLTDVVEESIFFVNKGMSQDDFWDFCGSIGDKYKQDAIVVGLDGQGVFLRFRGGGKEKIGTKLTLGKTSQAYSQMRNKKNVPFVFEGSLSPINNMSRQAFKVKNIEYFKD